MGTVRGPNVIGICLSTLQGGGSGWCLLNTGEGAGAASEGLGGHLKSQSGQRGTWGGGKTGGGFCLFRSPLEDESWNKVFERLGHFSPLVL